ncbi:Nuclear elongation and deformation protein 1 [Apiospora phragmitis]|uniref:Nuclear elongation and deformation protein 1 n=1 Tax=Apiospora phragmitis TaxID=2905665 RepID=A0ABR1URG4_9PEZI
MTEVVDHYFPAVATLVKGGGEEYTDFKYWREPPLEMDEFSASDDDDDDEDADDEDDDVGNLGDSYLSRIDDDDAVESIFSGSGVYEDEQHMMGSMMEEYEEDADDEDVDGEDIEGDDDIEGDEDEGEDVDEDEDEVEEENVGLKIPEDVKAKTPSPQDRGAR